MVQKISEGFVYSAAPNGRGAAGPRTAVMPDGSILCTYMTSSSLGRNDFIPMASYSLNGEDWTEGIPVWPQFIGKKSAFVSVRPMPDGRLSLAGMWFDIAGADEMFWSDEAGGMKENRLIWCYSDDGRHFPSPFELELPYYASAEQPGGLLARKSGQQFMIYAPYPTIEGRGEVLTNRLVILRSDDGGNSFAPGIIGRCDGDVTYAESWLVELGNGTLLAGSWMLDKKRSPDVYLISQDGGNTFKGPLNMGFYGQTTALTPYGEDGLLIVYNQRQEGTIGIWLAHARPDENGFNIQFNVPVWEAGKATRSDTTGDFAQWTDYAFGEPQVTVLPDGTLLLVFWCSQPDGTGVRYVHLQLVK